MQIATKKYFLIFLMAVGGLGCAGAIAMLLCGPRGDGPAVAMLWGVAIGFSLLLMFAASTAFDHRWWRFLAFAGIPVMFLGMICLLCLITLDIFRITGRISETAWTIVFTIYLGGALLCLLSWIGALRMASGARYLQGFTIVALIASFIAIELAFGYLLSQPLVSLMFTSLLISGLLTFTTLFLYRVMGFKEPNPLTAFDLKLHLRCPRCMTEQDLPTGGNAHCSTCHLRFHIDMDDPVCLSCGYNLRGLLRPICPECGQSTLSRPAEPAAAAS